MNVKVFQLHKRASYEYKYIQDKYAFDLNKESKYFAISDGTTQSYNSEIWAQTLTKAFIKNPNFNAESLIADFKKNATDFKNLKFNLSDNPAKASLEKEKIKRGATATFIGIELNKNNELSIISVGDSNLLIVRNNSIIKFPFETIEELDANDFFLNTEKLLRDDIDSSFFQVKKFKLEKNDVIIIGTDALSRFLFRDNKNYTQVLEINNFKKLHEFCLKNWENRQLEEDDITCIIIQTGVANSIVEIIPPATFSFPIEAEMDFVPVNVLNQNEPIKNENDMQEISRKLDYLNNELRESKKKLTVFQYLLTFIVALLFIIILLLLNSHDTNIQKQSVVDSSTTIDTTKHFKLKAISLDSGEIIKRNPSDSNNNNSN